MIQDCYVIFIIHNSEKPSTVRDYLKSRLTEDRLVNSYDVYRDNDDVIAEVKVINGVYYNPGCKGSRWEPGEPAWIEGCLDKWDFLEWMKYLLNLEFDDDFDIELDEDSDIPDEEDLLEELNEKEYWDNEEY